MSRTQSGPSRQPPSRSSACSAAACSAAFLLRPTPSPTRSESTIAATSKVRRCGGPGGGCHLVAYARPAPRQQLLQGGLEVDPGLGRVLDPRLERRRHRRRRALEAEGDETGADQRLGRLRQRPLAAEQHLGRDRRRRRRRARRRAASRGTPSRRPTSAQETPLTAWLWILVRPPASTSGKRSSRSAATESPSTLSPRKASRSKESTRLLGPGGVGQRLRPQLRGQLGDQRGERGDALSRRRRGHAASGRRVLEDEGDRVADRLDLRAPAPRRPRSRSGPRAPSPARRGRASRRRGPP